LLQTTLPWYRQVPGFRRGRRLNAAIALVGYSVIAAWIVQFPWNPSLGILGLLSAGTVIVAFNVLNSRKRIPEGRENPDFFLVQSPKQVVFYVNWALDKFRT
jgi:hypothetical protein